MYPGQESRQLKNNIWFAKFLDAPTNYEQMHFKLHLIGQVYRRCCPHGFMKKSASIAIIMVGIVVVGAVIVFSSGSFNDRNNSTSTQNNAANTSQGNNGTNVGSSQNTAGKHFTVTLEEQVGVQQK